MNKSFFAHSQSATSAQAERPLTPKYIPRTGAYRQSGLEHSLRNQRNMHILICFAQCLHSEKFNEFLILDVKTQFQFAFLFPNHWVTCCCCPQAVFWSVGKFSRKNVINSSDRVVNNFGKSWQQFAIVDNNHTLLSTRRPRVFVCFGARNEK